MIQGMPTKHPLRFIQSHGKLAEALGLNEKEMDPIASLVEFALKEGWNMRRLFEAAGAMDLTDEAWATFLYTYGYWDGERRL